MLLKKSALLLLTMVIMTGSLLASCVANGVTTPVSTQAAKTWYQQTANDFKALLPVTPPETLWPADGKRTDTDFNVNKEFSVLTHLSMQQGYVLDYLYLSDGTAGGPILYVRPADATPFKNYTEYKDAAASTPRPSNDKSLIWLVKGATTSNFGNKISIDGSKEGYFEYALLQTIGNKFYLFGFTQQSDTFAVCEKSAVENIITELEASNNGTLDSKFVSSATKLAVEPKVQIDDVTVTVQLVTFSPMMGFNKVTLTILKNYPNTITEQVIESLLDYPRAK